eukprot:3471085-Amphidinium_carterae.1
MIGLQSTSTNETQPVVTTATAASESRMMRQSQALQVRRRAVRTPPRNVQPRQEIVARDNAVEMVFAQSRFHATPSTATVNSNDYNVVGDTNPGLEQ